VSLKQLFDKYHDKIQFVMIYIREAHPVDGWTFGQGMMASMVHSFAPLTNTNIHDPQTIDERRHIAFQCKDTLQYGFKTYVDEMDDRVNTLYAAKPTRLYLIGLEGKVVYAGGIGPLGFKPAELECAIDHYLNLQQGST